MKRKEEIDALISRYQNGTCTPQEQELLERMLFTDPAKQAHVSDLDNYGEEVWTRIYLMTRSKRSSLKRWYYAAASVFVIGLSAYFFVESQVKDIPGHDKLTADIVAGTTKATLTLADGSIITLDSTRTGIVVNANEITYSDGNRLLALNRQSSGEEDNKPQFAILATPAGGTYQLILPDGTKVWLNASSTLRYPTEFKGANRVVEIEGEGYFDVAKVPSVPFIVKSRRQETVVLGTEFNISAYEEEETEKTTVVSGSVRVHAKVLVAGSGYAPQLSRELAPQEQSVVTSSGAITKHKANVRSAVAWKSGNFYFKGTAFDDMVRQIARWYDIEVVYTNKIPQETFSGTFKRTASLASILEFLKGAGITCRMEGRKLLVE